MRSAVVMPFLAMLGSMAIVPAIRPLFAAHGAPEGAMQAFMSLNMLGAALGAPLLSSLADRRRVHRDLALVLALLDAVLIAACSLSLPVPVLLALRTLQGVANVGLLSLLMAMATRGSERAGHSGLGAAGAVMTAAIALGPPLGGVLLGLGPRAPFLAAAALNLAIACLLLATRIELAPRLRAASRPRASWGRSQLVVPLLLAFTERFTVGCFVVSFALFGHHALGLSDRAISLKLTLFVAPFALAMYPMWKASERFSRARTLWFGGLGYGLSFMLLAVARGPALDLALIACGLTSAMMYAPSLCYAAALAPPEARATSMAMFNAAGCLGMMCGPALAGVSSAALASAGQGPGVRYPLIFLGAGAVQIMAMVMLRRRIQALHDDELPRRAEMAGAP